MHRLAPFARGERGSISFGRAKKDISLLLYGCVLGIIAIIFFIMLSQLFRLTIVKGQYYAGLAHENRTNELIIEHTRGTITDRKGRILVYNQDPDVHTSERAVSKRVYRDGPVFAHVVGYRGYADTDDIAQDACRVKLFSGDRVGKKGVEKMLECTLRGVHGKKLVETDAKGSIIKDLSIIPSQRGTDVQLAIDSDLQKRAYELTSRDNAAVVVLNPTTGEILALTSTPSFDPQDFESETSFAVNRFLQDEEKPLFNRATEGTYPPASTFKMVVVAAALEEGVVDADEVIEDTGSIQAGDAEYTTWYYTQYGKTDGQVDMVKALQRSNDIYFYRVGEKVGPTHIKKWSTILGFEQRSGIGIEESLGLIPSPFWKQDTLNEQWFLGDTYNISIGQGYVLSTPLQVARMTSAIAHDGTMCDAQLLKVDHDTLPPQCKKLPLHQGTLDVIREGMVRACEPGGTGVPFFEFTINGKPFSVACKTGTAESATHPEHPHAWFTIYAPVEDPRIVVTVLVEGGGQGSEVAAPIAHELLTSYFTRKE